MTRGGIGIAGDRTCPEGGRAVMAAPIPQALAYW